ncbi:mitochondrial putative cruciform cutting endonuclease 1 [Xylogone sp. PMI_703]|nr:mitochondrial putative cruciform cutting endonuclease 1 [Xylogone sp. PMI_703]
MALNLPATLKLAQLKTLAFQCGISNSGTKPILRQRLVEEITASRSLNHGSERFRILSIDMGIRNLAYCILDVPFGRPSSSRNSKLSSRSSIQAWQRLSVSTTPTMNVDSSIAPPKESFSPASLSEAAYTLLRTKLLLANPTHVLIERQRHRSSSSPHILEWTIRVNMFESILYAILHTLKAEGIWSGQVLPIAPGKVGPFWVGEDEKAISDGIMPEVVGKMRKAKTAKAINKGLKIDLVRKWLETGDMVTLGSKDVKNTADAYLEKWNRLPGQRKPKKDVSDTAIEQPTEEMGKLDDLADSLLQAMAWLEWEKNKALVLEHGVDALLIS